MAASSESPRFGEADLSNCERELIHLSGSIQPHGMMLVLAEPRMVITQVSANVATLIGCEPEALLNQPIELLGADFAQDLRRAASNQHLANLLPLRTHFTVADKRFTATVLMHRPPAGGLVLEFEEVKEAAHRRATPHMAGRLTKMVTQLATAHSIPALADFVVREMRNLLGYDRVMVYRFDPDGHGAIIAEEKEKSLEAYLNRHYPSTDIPQRARELYLRNKVRVLVDVGYTPVPLVPRLNPTTGDDLDLSMATLRSVSPLHVQYLSNMGVKATLVASLIHDGKLWGLISCHHLSTKVIPYDLRAAVELVAEVVSTRISALEHFAEAQAEVLVRRLEQRLLDATSTDGDWRRALFDTPRQLLHPVGASGAALLFDGEVHTTGDVPSTPDLRALFSHLDAEVSEPVFACSSMAKLDERFEPITPVAAGVLAVRFGTASGEYLIWFRKEQLQDITWGGDPRKAVSLDDNQQLTPRASFAAWHEQVRDTSIPWTPRETSIAKAIGQSLSDIILQIRAVRVLLAEAQLTRMRASVIGAAEPIVIADEKGRVLLANDALARLLGGPFRSIESLHDLASHFEQPSKLMELFAKLRSERVPWRGELRLGRSATGTPVPVAVRADAIPDSHGGLFGCILVLTDLTARHAADVTRERLQRAAYAAQRHSHLEELGPLGPLSAEVQALVAAVWANAGVAVSEIADSADTGAIAPLLQEVEAATRQAARLSALLGRYAAEDSSAAS
jgi:chemotaxis family two-component system sensor kinase Cph1